METTQVNAQAAPTSDNIDTSAQAATITTSDAPAARDGQETISLEEARKLRSEAANLRKRLKAFEDEKTQLQNAQLSEIELTKKQHAELQARHDAYVHTTQERIVKYEVERLASSMHIIDPDAAAKLLDRTELEIDDETGLPTNAEKLLERLIKQKPWLISQQQQQQTTATQANGVPPKLPANNPGRSSIAAPGATPPGKIPRLTDYTWKSS